MKLYFIRHGETVDNVAGLYAGVRDSALTNHGVEQARRLGQSFTNNGVKLSHIFASPLSRAFKTAEALQKAQLPPSDDKAAGKRLDIVKVQNLIEQDFGFYEGKPFYARSGSKQTGREAYHEQHKNEPGFVDVESKESMCQRADTFLDEHLVPLFEQKGQDQFVVAVVSHGMLLGNLWRRLLVRLPRKSLVIAPEVMAARENLVLEHLGGWGNTGYLELLLQRKSTAETLEDAEASASAPKSRPAQTETAALPTPVPPPVEPENAVISVDTATAQKAAALKPPVTILHGWSTTILAVDSKEHLIGLKRQRGGIGRATHDEGQKKLDSFFKRQKTG